MGKIRREAGEESEIRLQGDSGRSKLGASGTGQAGGDPKGLWLVGAPRGQREEHGGKAGTAPSPGAWPGEPTQAEARAPIPTMQPLSRRASPGSAQRGGVAPVQHAGHAVGKLCPVGVKPTAPTRRETGE